MNEPVLMEASWNYCGISIKWTPLVYGKSVCFKEMLALQRIDLKINIKQIFNEELVLVMVFQVDAFSGMALKRKSFWLLKKKSNFHLISVFKGTIRNWDMDTKGLRWQFLFT